MKWNRPLITAPALRLGPEHKRSALRLGFLPENDCAPVVVAQEFGIFERYGLKVELRSAASWKHLHDQFHQGLLEAAHAPAMLPFLMNLGLTPERCACVAGLVLSLQGNGIAVSTELWQAGVRDGHGLAERALRDPRRTYRFGVACPFSSQYVLLCQWLKAADVPHEAVRIEFAPTEHLFPLLKLGYLDGYCAAEPWSTIAQQAGVGERVATSFQLAPLHPEKVLMARKDFVESCPEEHDRLLAALLEACFLCDQPENRSWLCQLLANPRFINAPVECLEPGLAGPVGRSNHGSDGLQELSIFYRSRANEPSAAKAAWLTGRLYEFLHWTSRPAELDGVFRPDLYHRAQRLLPKGWNHQLSSKAPPPAWQPEGSLAGSV